MQESKPMKKFDSKIDMLRIGEYCGHDLVWVNPNNPNYKEIVANNMSDGLGRGIKVISPNGQEHIALLVDFDYNENGKLTRFIFVYFDGNFKREFTVDTNHQIGWSVFYEDHCYKL